VHFFFDPEFSKESTTISKTELVHFKSLRISIGETIGVTTGKGTGFLARVMDPGSGMISDVEELPSSAGASIHLVQSIAKGGRDETALQNATELGIASATALQAERSVSRWDNKVEKNIERWRQIAISAIKQSQQLNLPDIYYAGSVAELTPRGMGLVLDPRAMKEFGEIGISGEVTLVVGPEGGFSESEIEKLESRGFVPVRFGQSILRTSSAGPAAIACVQLLSGKYGKRLD
jgi:16S rRNA (uracil1498-N3)-methyltransferase